MVGPVTAGAAPCSAATRSTVAVTAPVANSRLSPGRKGVTTSPVSQKTISPSIA